MNAYLHFFLKFKVGLFSLGLSLNKWVLQIKASLTAFEHEVKANYSEKAFSTPEEFKELVIEHMKKNLTIYFNEGDSVTLQNAYVKLGHETNVVFEVIGVPKSINSVFVKNTGFKDIYKNQSALVILKKDFAKEQFVLNNDNHHTAKLELEGSKFILLEGNVATAHSSSFYLKSGALLMIFGLIVYLFKKPKKNIEIELS